MERPSLIRLHRYNGWNLLFLLLSGAALYMPGLRPVLAPIRTLLKYLHIGSGLLSLTLLVAYLPQAREHWHRLRDRVGQQANVILLTALLLGWGLTGALLWFNRYLPNGVAESALVWHDRLTWFAIPWAAAHSITRYFKIRIISVKPPLEDRRIVLAGLVSFAVALLWNRIGQSLNLPGFEPGPSDEPPTNTHEPIPDGAAFLPPAISTPPAGGGSKGRFRVYTVTEPLPRIAPSDWRLEISGLVDRPMELSWQDFLALPRTEQVSNFHCVTGWSVYNITWEGVRLRDLLDHVAVRSAAKHVKFYSGDGIYTDAIPLEVARMGDVMLPYRMDGGIIPGQLGGPVRLIIPEMYAYKSVKWVTGVELIDRPHIGYWEQRGYPADAWLRKS